MPTAEARLRRLLASSPEALLPEPPPPPPPSSFLDLTPAQSQVAFQNLPSAYNVKYGGDVLGGTWGKQMGVHVKIEVSWEEVQAGAGLHLTEELWIRVLSKEPMAPTLKVPEEVSGQITPEVLARYNHITAAMWQPDLREDDDETIPEWPYEQWWALPKMRTVA